MINEVSIVSIQLSIIILETTANLLQPEYSIKILNTENTVLSLGDVDNDDDLEIIKSAPDDAQMQEKLNKFHKYVNFIEMTERPKEKFYSGPYQLNYPKSFFEMAYPDSLYAIAVNEKHLSELERRSKIRRKKKKKRKRRKMKKNVWRGNQLREKELKRRPRSSPDFEEQETEYNYMEKEYFDYVAESMNKSTAFKYSDEGKPEESVKDVVYKIMDVKTPKNCTNYTGLGIQAFECIVKNFKNGELNRRQFINSISIILLIWFCIYLLVALPLWCSKGWCCCCCRCAFCFPRKTVTDIQKYIAENPPGVLTDSKGIKENYTPTPKETELYDRLRRLIADF